MRLLQERNCTVRLLADETGMGEEAVYQLLWTLHDEGVVEPVGLAAQEASKPGPKPIAWRWCFPELPAVQGLREYLQRTDVVEADVPGYAGLLRDRRRRGAHELLDLARMDPRQRGLMRITDITEALRVTGDIPNLEND